MVRIISSGIVDGGAPSKEDAVQSTGDSAQVTSNTNGADSTPAPGITTEITSQVQGQIKRTKTEVIEKVLTRTGTIVKRRLSQGMQEAGVVVEKVR